MTKIQRVEMEVELHNVTGAKKTLFLKIMKLEDEIENLKKHIEIQVKREKELEELLKQG